MTMGTGKKKSGSKGMPKMTKGMGTEPGPKPHPGLMNDARKSQARKGRSK